MAKADATANQGAMVPFNQNIFIDSSKRLPEYDNGKSLAYAAQDSRDSLRKCIALIADPGQFVRWKSINSYDNIADTSLFRLVDHGVIYWPTVGKQRYAILYDGAVGGCLGEVGELSKVGWRHPDILEYLISPVISVLSVMGDKGLSHSAIRPDNLFFGPGKNKNQPIILGDCLSAHPHSTQPSVFMSVERALAEPYGRGNGTIADDIYAFGVSIAMLLRKNNELEGLSDKEIVRRKFEFGSYTTLVGSERFQASFIELLRGLMHDDPSLRWTLDDIFAWLDGTRITPPGLTRRKKANRPFTFMGKKYLFADTLALDMADHPAETVKVFEGDELPQWIDKAISDKELGDNFDKAMGRIYLAGISKENEAFVHAHICMALNPMLPIYYNRRVFTYDGIGGLMAKTSAESGNMAPFKEVLQKNILDQSASLKTVSQTEVLSHIKNFDLCRGMLRQKSHGNSVERCMYSLCVNAPCFSRVFKDHFVYDARSCLRTFEELSAKGGQVAIFMDAHSLAFFSVHEQRLIEPVAYDLNSMDKDKKIEGNLKFLSLLQRKSKILSVPAIAKVFSDSLVGVYEVYNNLKLREQIIDGVKGETKKGDLVGMSALIDNHTVRQRDVNAFQLAKREYKLLEYEYNQYNSRLANKRTYGVVNGQESAALVSWIIATGVTVLSVFAFVSGYRIF